VPQIINTWHEFMHALAYCAKSGCQIIANIWWVTLKLHSRFKLMHKIKHLQFSLSCPLQ